MYDSVERFVVADRCGQISDRPALSRSNLFSEKRFRRLGKSREKAFIDLRRLLAVHETVEEEIIHPRAKRKIANGAAVVKQRLSEEHAEQRRCCSGWRSSTSIASSHPYA